MLPLLLAFPVHALQFGSSGSAGEVYGATGRIGSLLLRSGAGKLAAVPRGLAPGCLSPPGTPILVTVPTDALADVLRATPPQRQPDLVLLCNGAARERVAAVLGEAAAAKITAGCLFFGVLAPGASPTHGAGAPRTALAGPHAAATAELIERMGPRCEVPPQASHSAPSARTVGRPITGCDISGYLQLAWGVHCCPTPHGLLEDVAWPSCAPARMAPPGAVGHGEVPL